MVVKRQDLKPFVPDDDTERMHVFVSVTVNKIEMSEPETKYLSGIYRGEEVSQETYRIYLDTIYEEPPMSIDFGSVAERNGDKIAVDLHKEEIFVEK